MDLPLFLLPLGYKSLLQLTTPNLCYSVAITIMCHMLLDFRIDLLNLDLLSLDLLSLNLLSLYHLKGHP